MKLISCTQLSDRMASILISRLLINIQKAADQDIDLGVHTHPQPEFDPMSTDRESRTIVFAHGISGQSIVIFTHAQPMTVHG